MKKDELEELKDKVTRLTQKMENSEQEKIEMKREIKGLQDKTGLYDSVLEAVMPSLALPLTAPEENAKITLREAAMKDIAHNNMAIALSRSTDVISREMHTAILEQKDEMIAIEKERREEMKDTIVKYKKELEVKEMEVLEARKAAQEANQTATSLSTRADRLQKERDTLNAKYNAALKGHEQSSLNHGKHGQSMLAKLLYTQKRGYTAVTEQEADQARAIERDYARRESQKRARQT